tara:strand:+ start:392 stop:580 length:189 start_codon:yes stop_codon:yes gene_type:complete
MANKKIYTLVICFDENEGSVEYIHETIEREGELPDNLYESKYVEELDEYLEILPDITEIGEA